MTNSSPSNATITETRSTANCQFGNIGLNFEVQPDGNYVVSRVQKGGLFDPSELRAGQEVVSINGTTIFGKPSHELFGLIAPFQSKQHDLTIKTRPTCRLYAGIAQSTVAIGRTQCDVQYEVSVDPKQKKDLPTVLKSAGVGQSVWNRLVAAHEMELVPALKAFLERAHAMDREMRHFQGKRCWKGWVAFYSCRHDVKCHQMTRQLAILQSNINLVANNLVSKANILLSEYGIMAELAFGSKDLPVISRKRNVPKNVMLLPVGLKFSLVHPEEKPKVKTSSSAGAKVVTTPPSSPKKKPAPRSRSPTKSPKAKKTAITRPTSPVKTSATKSGSKQKNKGAPRLHQDTDTDDSSGRE